MVNCNLSATPCNLCVVFVQPCTTLCNLCASNFFYIRLFIPLPRHFTQIRAQIIIDRSPMAAANLFCWNWVNYYIIDFSWSWKMGNMTSRVLQEPGWADNLDFSSGRARAKPFFGGPAKIIILQKSLLSKDTFIFYLFADNWYFSIIYARITL